jgi:hypothetical protein
VPLFVFVEIDERFDFFFFVLVAAAPRDQVLAERLIDVSGRADRALGLLLVVREDQGPFVGDLEDWVLEVLFSAPLINDAVEHVLGRDGAREHQRSAKGDSKAFHLITMRLRDRRSAQARTDDRPTAASASYVVSPPVRDLLLRAKHLFVEAMHG